MITEAGNSQKELNEIDDLPKPLLRRLGHFAAQNFSSGGQGIQDDEPSQIELVIQNVIEKMTTPISRIHFIQQAVEGLVKTQLALKTSEIVLFALTGCAPNTNYSKSETPTPNPFIEFMNHPEKYTNKNIIITADAFTYGVSSSGSTTPIIEEYLDDKGRVITVPYYNTNLIRFFIYSDDQTAQKVQNHKLYPYDTPHIEADFLTKSTININGTPIVTEPNPPPLLFDAHPGDVAKYSFEGIWRELPGYLVGGTLNPYFLHITQPKKLS